MMTYQKTTWKNRLVERPGTYTFRQNADGSVTLLSAEGNVVEAGTPVNAENLNKIENALTELFTTAPINENRLTDMVQSLSGTGYRKLPGGLILQWGVRTTGDFAGSTTLQMRHNFAIQFPNACLFPPIVGIKNNINTHGVYTWCVGYDNSYVEFVAYNPEKTSCNISYIALGY